MATTEERLSRLEGAYDHLATKADVAALEARLLRWLLPTFVASLAAVAAIARLID